MPHPVQAHAQPSATTSGDTRGPLVVLTLLVFMWGLLTSLNDVLIPHLKAVYTLSYVQAMLVQLCFFGAYAIASVPASALVRRLGYQRGAVAGLVVAAGGCALFHPAANGGYATFLGALFVLACGVTILQVAANPYVAVLGDPAEASRRLTLTQAFNSLGTTVAPVIGGVLILGGAVLGAQELAALTTAEQAAYRAAEAASVQLPYLMLSAALLLLAFLFARARLPRIAAAPDSAADAGPIWRHRHLVLGVIAIFMYVGAEVSIGSFLINFLGESHIAALPAASAAHYVALYWGGAMVGRFAGFVLMRRVSPGRALAASATGSVLLLLVAILGQGAAAMWALLAVGLCNAIMFPVIFSMALHRLGAQTERASGLLCMAIVGGAIVPFAQALVADGIGLQASFWVPLACYAYVLFYGLRFARQQQGN